MTRISLLFCFLLTVLFSQRLSAQQTLTVDGTVRSYLEYVPKDLGTGRPLLISCHGMNQDAAYQKNMLAVESVADKEKFITVFPEGINRGWELSGDRDINFMKAIINKMVEKYGIDANRVYISGFSMGGMFTYHCMNKLSDKIAAFAPISGYPMGGFNCTTSRPLPVIHTHGTTDDVVTFSNVQNNLNVLINHNKCNTTATVTKNYLGYSHITKHLWSGGTNGANVVLMELANKGHWVSNDGLKTVEEIWKFCKNYSLEPKPVTVSIVEPKPGKVSEDIKVKAEVTSTAADMDYVSIYLDSKLKKKFTEPPYEFTITGVADGEHKINVLGVDKSGNRASAAAVVNVIKGYVPAGKCLAVKTPDKGANLWDDQANYNISALTKGKSYTLTLKAKATSACTMAFWPSDTQSSNKNQWGGTNDVQYLDAKNITTQWATYTWKFNAAFPLDRISLEFGGLNGTMYIDDVKLVDDAIGVNFVQNGDFEDGNYDGWFSDSGYRGTSLSLVECDNEGAISGPKEPVIPDTWEFAEQGNPNFHVYLCFGQSNMEGNAAVEAVDKTNVPDRFKMLAAVNFGSTRTKGNWYKAVPPLCRQGTGLTPVDYFGRTLVEKLPEDITVGVCNVAVGGAKIELFMEEFKDEYIAGEAGWFQNYCAEYNNDPLGRLIEMGKIAQKTGVIKGILLHQGESNNGQADWAEKVAKVYKRICYNLGLNPAEVPLLAGETLYQNQGGACYWHNTAALPKLKEYIPNSYVISAKDLPGNGVDAFHFNAAGYRTLGKRYAEQMLKLLPEYTDVKGVTRYIDADNTIYNMQGQRVTEMKKGNVYVIGNKKVLMK